jgi:diguanylate cyclase (GGDEF)-like protein
MDDIILQSVIELTQQRDIDSVEISLITTLSEFIPANAIFLVKPSDETIGEFFEVMRLSITGRTGCKQEYKWIYGNNVYSGSKVLQECFNDMQPVHYEVENELKRFLFPIIHNNSTVAALGVETDQDLSSWHSIIAAFIKIYSNYVTILNVSERDKLTELYNRRTFDYKLDKLLKAQRLQYDQYGNSLETDEKRRTYPNAHSWIAMVDIDFFKRINDTYGHLFGDEVILILSQQMKHFFRRSDLLFRFGGEEFVIILAPVPAKVARQILERFRASFASYNIPQVGETTISIGYAKTSDGASSHIILDHADKALYYAKEHGRNCVFNYEELVDEGFLSDHKKSNVTLFTDDVPDAS